MNLNNKDNRRRVTGVKVADAFKLTHHSLLKLKRYKGLVYSKEQEIGEISQIVDVSEDTGGMANIKQRNKSALNKMDKNYASWGMC